MFTLKDLDASVALSFPLAEAGGSLYIPGDALVRLDLATGDVESEPFDGGRDVLFFARADTVHYAREVKPEGVEIGRVDTEKLALKPAFTLRKEDHGEVAPLLAFSPDGKQMALPAKKSGKNSLLILAGGGVRKSIPLELPPDTCDVGNLEWSPDGTTIYAALLWDKRDSNVAQLGFGEITLATGTVRVVPMVRASKSAEPEPSFLFFQIALSPDGKTLAFAPTFLELEDPKDAALHLVDLTKPDRTVTRIAAPRR
jgi:hypothetical protein